MSSDSVAHIFIPGLDSPLGEWQRSYGWLPQASGLKTLLNDASRLPRTESAYHKVAALLGVQGALAGFRERGAGRAVSGAVCADPVHLRADVDSALLVEGEHLGLDENQARDLLASVQDWFGRDGWRFTMSGALHWYAFPPQGLEPPPWPEPAEIAGSDVGPYIRGREQSAEWRRFYTELQMLLARAPVNLGRMSQDEPAVNALWFWGGRRVGNSASSPVSLVFASDPILIGMADAAGIEVKTIQRDEVLRGGGIAWLNDLRPAAAYDDIEAWQTALSHLDEVWFAPLAKALRARHLKRVHVYGDAWQWECRRRAPWRLLRQSAPLSRALGVSS